MIYLLLSISSSTLIAVFFKLIEKKGADTFAAIVINYFVAACLGFVLIKDPLDFVVNNNLDWLPMAVILGVLFIGMFYLMAISTQKAGMSITTISVRLAVVIPILFSIIHYHEVLTGLKIAALCIAVLSMYLILFKEKSQNSDRKYLYLPLIIFVGSGIIDSTIKYTQAAYLSGESIIAFTAVLFFISFIIGTIVSAVRKNGFSFMVKKKTWLVGCGLGLVNFGSLYFFINVLNHGIFASSIAFGINHIGIVLLTVVVAWLLFKEKLNLYNKIGIALSILTIALLSLV